MDFGKQLSLVRERAPLVQCITNFVTVNDCANIVLAAGGSPSMADDVREAAEAVRGAAAFLCGVMRMLSGRTIQAVVGAIFGPILGGLLYRKFHNFWVVLIGEVFGTGVVGAMVAYPLMKMFYGLDAQSPFYYIPFYTPSAVVGGCMGVAVLLILKRTGVLNRMKQEL